jgi:uncharacterized protein YndB with AHSA1/START domain
MSTPAAPQPAPMIRLNKLVQAPAQRVYDAWLDPAQMKRWWLPDTSAAACDVQIDPRVGGAFRINMGTAEKPFVAVGKYTVMDPPRRLAFTWSWEQTPGFADDSLVTIEFYEIDNPRHPPHGEDQGDGTSHSSPRATEIVFTHERLNTALSRSDHTGGWWSALVALGYHVRGIDPREAMKAKGS